MKRKEKLVANFTHFMYNYIKKGIKNERKQIFRV